MIELLSKYPIVEAACSKVKISRSTHYKWMSEDDKYRERVDEALAISIETVNDLAENNIIAGIKRGDHKSSTYWLNHNKERYKPPSRMREASSDEPEIDFLDEAMKRLPGYVPPPANIPAGKKKGRYGMLNAKTLKLLEKYDLDDDLDDDDQETEES